MAITSRFPYCHGTMLGIFVIRGLGAFIVALYLPVPKMAGDVGMRWILKIHHDVRAPSALRIGNYGKFVY